MSKKSLGILALVVAMISWGPAAVFTKIGITEIPPFTYGMLRYAIASLILLPIFFAYKHHRIAKSDIKRFILVGFLGSGLNLIMFMSGLSRTSAVSASAIFATVPVVNAFAAALILRERPTTSRIVGIMIGLAGSFLIAVAPALYGSNTAGTGDFLGNLFIFGAVTSWVAYIIFSKELLEKYSPLTITTYSFLIGVVTILPLSFFETVNNPFWYANVDIKGLSALMYSAVFASVVPFFLYQWGLKRTSAFEAGIVNYLNPVAGAFSAAVILGEIPTPVFYTGTALIFSGVFLASIYETMKKRKLDSASA